MNSTPPKIRFRDTELSLLRAFVTEDAKSSCPNVIVQGHKSVGKTHTVLSHLQSINVKSTVINCDEFITQKILLQKCLQSIRVDSGIDLSTYHQKFMYKGLEAARISLLCENFSNFLMALEQFVEETGYNDHHVLVLDRFDQCIDSTDDIFRSFLMFREFSLIRNITIIYITSHEDPREIITCSVPHVHFLPYTRDQVVEIMSSNPPSDFFAGSIEVSYWENFCKLLVDLFFDYTGSDLKLLGNICSKLWPKFVQPISNGSRKANDFLRVYRELRDEIFRDDVVNNSTVKDFETGKEEEQGTSASMADLPFYLKYILIATYLASYVEPKNDVHLFSTMKTVKKKRDKKGESQVTKKDVDSRLLSAAYFDLERLKAILSVIYRNESPTLSKDNAEFFNFYQDLSERELAKKESEFTNFTVNKNVDINTQLSTLVSLGLMSRTYAMDILSSKIRWKCNVSWDVIQSIAEDLKFPLHSYILDK